MTSRNRYCRPSGIIFTLLALCVPAFDLMAQGATSVMRFGVHGGAILNTPSASFTELPGVQNCLGMTTQTSFEGGSGGGYSVGGIIELRPIPSAGFLTHLGAVVKVGYSSSTTAFDADEQIGRASDQNGQLTPVVDRYTIETHMGELHLEPSVSYWVSPSVPLMLSIGGAIGLITGATYNQSEHLVSPGNATYTDGSRERNQNSGDMAESGSGSLNTIGAGLTLGIGYDIAVTPRFAIRPEISGVLGLTSPLSGVDWKSHQLRAGVSFLFTPQEAQSTPLQD